MIVTHIGPKKTKIEFQGRKAKRADSRERRRLILEAALRVIIRDGMRGMRHRAIATEASVPLAATTYYFKDINELISDAFNLFAENSSANTQQLVENSFRALEQHTPEQLREPSTRKVIADGLIEFMVEHIERQVRDRDGRVLEHAFRNEALRNPILAKHAAIPQQQTLALVVKFCRLLESSDPEADAEIVNGVIMQLEYQALTSNAENNGIIRRTITHMVEKIIA